MFVVTGWYFASNLDARTFLVPDVAHLVNCFGAALSFTCLAMTLFSIMSTSTMITKKLGLTKVKDFENLWIAMEQKIRDASLLVLFSIVGISAGMSTEKTFAVVTVVSIFLGRQTAKYFDMQIDISDDSKPVTWVQNVLACILFVTAFVAGISEEGHKFDIVDSIVLIAAGVQLILVISKLLELGSRKRRMIFEETICSLYHFVVVGSLLSRVKSDSKSLLLISIAAVIIADFSARFQKHDPEDSVDRKDSVKKDATEPKVLVTRAVVFTTSATAAVASVLLFHQASGKEKQLATFAMVASVLKTLNCLSFLFDSQKESYKSVYNFISNGCTSLILLTVSILLGMNRSDPKGLTVVLLCAALASRIADMVQNAYASPHKEDTKLYKSSIDDDVIIDSAKLSNFRAIVVFILLVVGTVLSATGAAEICPEFLQASNHTNVTVTVDGVPDYCGSQEDVNLMLSYFSIMTGHAGLALVAFIVAAAVPEKSPVHFVALSTVEIPRVLVSTTIIVLGGLVLGTASNAVLSMSYVVYALADGLGMSLM